MHALIEATSSGWGSNSANLLLGQIDTTAMGFDLGIVINGVINLLIALAWLIGGWIIALIVSSAVQSGLKRTNIDNRLADWMAGERGTSGAVPIEKWVGVGVFWIIMIFAIVAFLDALNLEVVSQPLNSFLDEITSYSSRLIGAGALLGLAWVLATVVKLAVTRLMDRLQVEQRLQQQLGDPEGQSSLPLSDTLGNVLYWFILLFFLPSILSTLDLQGPLAPVQNLLDSFLAALPQIFKALIVAAIGWVIARLVRMIVTNFLRATGSDQLGERFGLSAESTEDGQGIVLSELAGTIVYAVILILTAITALNELQIEAISQPAIALLNDIVLAIPLILRAGIILVIAYVISRFVTDIVTNILTDVGFNNVLGWIGFEGILPDADPETSETEATPSSTAKTPSEIVGIVAGIGIMLFGLIEANNALQLDALGLIFTAFIAIAGQIIAGLIVLAIGLYFANIAFRVINMAGTRQSYLLAQAARISIIVLITAMALQQMGVATNIVNLAFGLLTGGIAIAIAIAFGIGGTEVAADQLRRWVNDFRNSQ